MRVYLGRGEFLVPVAGRRLDRLPITTTGLVNTATVVLQVRHLLAKIKEKVGLKFVIIRFLDDRHLHNWKD